MNQAFAFEENSPIHQPTLADALALRLIKFYKNRISPRKGYGCSKRLFDELVGSPNPHSCSTHAVMAIKEGGILHARIKMRERFGECKEAAIKLRTMNLYLLDPVAIQHATGRILNCAHGAGGCNNLQTNVSHFWNSISANTIDDACASNVRETITNCGCGKSGRELIREAIKNPHGDSAIELQAQACCGTIGLFLCCASSGDARNRWQRPN
jgi:putative component of membrane protein insertase Oxa1/YidC/SpoIIIJ protein YidD